jgi:hypothetical protein
MSDPREELRKIYAEWPTEKLIREYKTSRSGYTPAAVRAIENELRIRDANVDLTFPCPRCGKSNPGSALRCDCGEVLQTLPTPLKAPSPEQVLKPLKANKKISDEERCGICNGPLVLGEEIAQCEKCLKVFHLKCKDDFGGCNSPQCQVDMKKCPFCKELIRADALKCRHCGEYVDDSVRKSVEPKECPKEAKDALTYSLVGIFCFGFILGPIAIGKGLKALKIIKSQPGCPGKGKAQAGIIIGVLETLLYIAGFIARMNAL